VVGLSTRWAGRGRDLLQQATGRLDEVQGLLEADPANAAPQVPHTLETFNRQAREGADLLMASYTDDRDPATITAVREFAASGLGSIASLADVAPAAAQPGLREAALALQEIDARAARLCGACTDLPALRLPPTLLASAEVDRALQQVRAVKLDNSHPVIVEKQAARRADAASGQERPTEGGGGVGAPTAPSAPRSGASVPAAPSTPKADVKVDLDGGGVTDDLTDDLTSNLGDGLGGVVETLLPDPTTDLLP
jgi:hypothetical protein